MSRCETVKPLLLEHKLSFLGTKNSTGQLGRGKAIYLKIASRTVTVNILNNANVLDSKINLKQVWRRNMTG